VFMHVHGSEVGLFTAGEPILSDKKSCEIWSRRRASLVWIQVSDFERKHGDSTGTSTSAELQHVIQSIASRVSPSTCTVTLSSLQKH